MPGIWVGGACRRAWRGCGRVPRALWPRSYAGHPVGASGSKAKARTRPARSGPPTARTSSNWARTLPPIGRATMPARSSSCLSRCRASGSRPSASDQQSDTSPTVTVSSPILWKPTIRTAAHRRETHRGVGRLSRSARCEANQDSALPFPPSSARLAETTCDADIRLQLRVPNVPKGDHGDRPGDLGTT